MHLALKDDQRAFTHGMHDRRGCFIESDDAGAGQAGSVHVPDLLAQQLFLRW